MKVINDIKYSDLDNIISKHIELESKNDGRFKVISYENSYSINIEFLKTGYVVKHQLAAIKSGSVKDRSLPSVFGVGCIGDKYKSRINGKKLKEYVLWLNMISRCYSPKKREKDKVYNKCTISDNFKNYTYFYEWCNKQVGFENKDWHLDKDLLYKRNTTYSEDTCVFLPQEINKVLTKTDKKRGDFPIGVHWCKTHNCFISQINKDGTKITIGKYKSANEAFIAYKRRKESHLKELANRYKSFLDIRAYEALLNYEVDIDD